jgi:hypothetical protein
MRDPDIDNLKDSVDLERGWGLKGGFSQTWSIQKCEIESGLLVPKGRGYTESYYPSVHCGIPGRLAAVTEGDERAVLKFSQEYGHLGYGQLASRQCWRPGDPLNWIWAHARTLRLCFVLAEQIEVGRKERLLETFGVIQGGKVRSGSDFEPRVRVAIRSEIIPLSRFVRGELRDVLGAAQLILQVLLSENTKGVHRVLAVDEDDSRRTVNQLMYAALIEVAYWQLQDAVIARRIKRCKFEACGSHFIQKHGRQEFCPPYRDDKTKISKCANRSKVYRFRGKD